LLLQGHPGDTSLFLLPAHAEAPTSITASLNMHKPHTLAPAAAAAAKPVVQASVQVHNLAVGLDGILKIVAAVEAATAGPQHAAAAAAAGAEIQQQPSQQQLDEAAAAAGSGSSSSSSSSSDFKLHLELLQCQLLSCKAAAAAAATARTAAELMPWEVPLQQLPTCSAADGVLCDLLLDLPYISLNLGPIAAAAAACQDGAPAATAAKPPPMALVQGLGVYLPEAPGSGVLLPVLSIPSVLFRESQQQQQQQQQGEAVLHDVHIPAVGASLRPLQVQHLVHLVDRQQCQWQQWTTGIPAKQPKQQQQKQKQPHPKQQLQLEVLLDDLQLLLLPAHGTSDKGLLLQLQQLQVQHAHNMLQPNMPDGSSSCSSRVLQQAKVCWSDLSLSAVQQQDDAAAAADSSSDWFAADNAPASAAAQQGDNPGPNQQQQQEQQQQQQQGEFKLLASSLPAVSWLMRTGSSSRSNNGQQQYPQLLPVSSSAFASAAAAAAVAAAGGGGTASGSGLGAPRMSAALPRTSSGALREALSNQATLTRFLSAKESWHGGSAVGSVVSADSFMSARGSSNVMLGSSSGSSWVTAGAGSSNSSTAAAAAAARGSSIRGSRPAAAAAVPMLDPHSSIIAASWQLDPPGASPPAGLGLCGSLPVSVAQSPSGGRTANAAAAGASRPPLQPVPSSVQQQQQGFATTEPITARVHQHQPSSRSISFSGGGGANSLHGGGLASGCFTGPNLWRRSASPPGLLSTSLRNVHSAGGVGLSSGQGLGQLQGLGVAGQRFGSDWQDDDAEFYSIAGDSSAADDISVTGDDDDPHQQQQHAHRRRCSSTGGTPSAAAAAKRGDAAVDDDGLLLTELLPLAGFDGEGCLATARWLLLSLSAGYSSSSSSSSTAPAAVQVTVAEQVLPPAAAAAASSSASQYEQVQTIIRVLLQGWQLHISGKSWDMAAACIMQAVNAAGSISRKAPNNRPQRQQQQSHKQEVQLLLDVQKLQAVLFLAPEAAAPCNPRQLRQQQQQEVSRSSRDCGPWQDPGSSPTAAAAAAGFGRRSAGPGAAAVSKDEQQQQQLAAETVTLELSAVAELGTSNSSSSSCAPPDNQQQQQQLVLQSFQVPELSVSVGAAQWDAAAARPVSSAGAGSTVDSAGNAAGSSQQQQQQEQPLLLLLLKGLQLQHAAASGGGGGIHNAAAAAATASNAALSDDRSTAAAAAAAGLTSDARGPDTRQHVLLTSSDALNPSDESSLGFEVHVGSISCWVSTTRLSLLLNLQQQLMAQLPAISAAADLAGGHARYRGDPAAADDDDDSAGAAAAAGAATSGDGCRADAFGSSKARSSMPAASGVLAAASSSGIGSSNSRSVKSPGSSSSRIAAVQQVVACSLTVHKLAVLCSTDEPDPWLLQQHGSSRGSVTASAAAAAAAAAGVAPTGSAGSSIDSSTAVPFTTCATPLLELALLPLQIDVQLVTKLAAAAGRSSSSSRRVLGVTVHGSCCADVYSVDKLGWEPLLDPWEFKVRSS
jgi:hypothetical protein